MLKQYIKWQLKKWWPLILIISLAISLPFVSMLQTASLSTTLYKTPDGYYYHGGSGASVVTASFMVLGVLAIVATFIVPIFVFVYRTSLQAVDCFYQAGYDKRTIRRTRALIGLGIILASFLIAFLLGVFILGLRYLATPEVEETAAYIRTRLDINFGYVILGGLFLMLVIAAQYCINCFLASLGDSVLVQIGLMLCGTAIMALVVFTPTMYIYVASELINGYSNIGIQFIAWSLGPVNFIGSFYEFFGRMVDPDALTPEYLWQFIVGLCIGIGLAGGAGTYLALANEPSGESAGHWKPRNVYISLIPHGAALVIGIGIAVGLGATSALLNIIGSYSLVLFYGVAYYALLSLMRKSFKPSKLDLILFLSVFGFVLLATIGMTALASSATARYINY